MKKVLIITYYWPPAGGSGVQRWLKFTRYLREFGWEPIIYTPENPEYPVIDKSLLKEIPENLTILRQPIKEPYRYYRMLTGRKEAVSVGFIDSDRKPGIAERFSRWVRGNFFIPDARKGWVEPSVNYLSKWLSENSADAIITTGPPHSMHLIGRAIRKKTNIPWVADFRDPWTGIDYYKELRLTEKSDQKHRQLEHAVLSESDMVITVGKTLAAELAEKDAKSPVVIENGYDEADFEGIDADMDSGFSILHAGMLPGYRNPQTLWDALSSLCREKRAFGSDLKIKLTGKTDSTVKDALIKSNLEPQAVFSSYKPHDQIVREMMSSQVLLIVLDPGERSAGVLSGKLFEYLAAGRPVLCLGDTKGDASELIRKTGCGVTLEHNDFDGIKNQIQAWYSDFRKGRLNVNDSEKSLYSRRNLTKRLAESMNSLISKSTEK